MGEVLSIIGGLIVAAVALGWWVRRHQRDIDGYQARDDRDPPAFTLPGR
jgi:hypothetical protein